MNQFLSRRTFILIPTMSILKIIFNFNLILFFFEKFSEI